MLQKLKIKNILEQNNVKITLQEGTKTSKYVYISHDSIVGKYCYINEYTRITKVNIGNFVSIGNNVAIGQGEHDLKLLSTSTYFIDNSYGKLTEKECVIKSDVWIGSYAFIKRGVTIGYSAVVGTHAVVTKDVPDFAIVVGVPAKIIGYRFEKNIQEKILKSKWWDKDIKDLENNKELFNKQIDVNIEELIKW